MDERERTASDAHNVTHGERERVTFAQAAERLGISRGALRMRVHRGSIDVVTVEGQRFVLWPALPSPSSRPSRTDTERVTVTGVTGDVTAAASLAAKEREIALLQEALDAERDARRRADQLLAAEIEARRRADTIILELSRHVVALPAGGDAAVDANKGAGATKPGDVGDDAATPAASSWSRFLRWLRGSEAGR